MALSLDILKNRDFRFLLFVRAFGTMALQAQAIIVGWQIYSLTKSPFILGLTGLAEAVPALSCALFAGHIVDISRPHRVLVISIGCLVLNVLVLFLIAGGVVDLPGHHIVLFIFVGVFCSGLGRSFTIPSSFSLLSQIVARKDIPAASAWLTSGFQMGIIIGPAVAGIIYGAYGPQVAWMLPLVLIVLQFTFAMRIGKPHRQYRSGEKRESAVKSIKAGWSFILGNRVLLASMSLDMLAVLFGGAMAMLPAYADQVLHIGSEGLGALRAAPAIGAGATTLYYALFPPKQIHARRLLWVMAGFGVAMIGFGLSTWFWLSMLCLMVSGMFDSVGMVIRQTLTQWLTPAPMRGRVSSVNSMFVISSNELGAFESGTAANWLGLVPSVVAGGVMTLIVVAVIATTSPKLRSTVIDAGEEGENAKT